MIGKVSQNQVRPVALGITSNSSTYGQTIPVIYGRTRGSVYLIWCAHIRQGPSAKKGKAGASKKGKGTATYVANADCLIGTNPIAAVLQCWDNNQSKLGLNFAEYSTAFASVVTIPDPMFYCLLGVTATLPYSVAFNDYGATGPENLSGSFEVPLWNYAYARPDPTADYDPLPYFYRWTPGSGPTVHFEYANLAGATLNFYYAQMLPGGDFISGTVEAGPTPLAALRLAFESVLGSGPEYNTAAYQQQQILYPHYAGVGSASFDLGAAGVAPSLRLEILGTHSLYPTGDADFADMVADLFGRAVTQAGYAASQAYTQVQHALPCYEFPGAIYRKSYQFGATGQPNPAVLTYDQPNTAGNFLVVAAAQQSGGSLAISDSAGNTWTPLFPGSSSYQVWYATARAANLNTVTVSNTGASLQVAIYEIAGVDTFDAAVTSSSGAASIATSNPAGTPGYLLAFLNYPAGNSPRASSRVHWKILNAAGSQFLLQSRIVRSPGSFTFTDTTGASQIALLAFKCSQPPSYPMPLGNILDSDSLLLARNQCRANGLWGSLIMDSQKKASDWLTDLYTAMDAAPVWSGFKLKSIPYSEVSAVGNGAMYVAPTSGGPVANLVEADFIGDASNPVVMIERKAQVDVPNLLQLQTPNRASDYNAVVTAQPEQGSIAVYNQRKDSPQMLNCIQDVAIARMVLGIKVRRQNYVRNTYKFKLKAKWKLLEPMDLVTITEPLIGISSLPVRLTSIAEDNQYNLDCEAEPFFYGVNAPAAVTVTPPSPYTPSTTTSPANVNAPIFIEPVGRLLGQSQAQLWIVVSDSNATYGGCQAFLSTDGGNSYNAVGTLTGSAITGVTTADWPAAADPDTANDLALDLTESNGTLGSYQASDEDNFVYPCSVAGGSGSIPYELMSYAVATLTAANKYTLKATGSGNHLRRAVFGVPGLGAGVDHPAGSRFAFLAPQASGILKLTMDSRWIGQTLWFKFLQFNQYGNGLASLSNVAAYSYVPVGLAQAATPQGSSTYTQTPADALSNPSATTIAMSPVTVQFASNAVKYNARSFTIPAPSSPTTYYVTIADPGYVGDSGTSANLAATCQTSQALCGVAGNTYIGSLVAQPGGGGTVVTPGGWPPPQVFLVNGQ